MLYSAELAPLFISLFFLACVVLWFAIKNHRNALLLGFIIPLVMISVAISYMSVDKILGYPINVNIPEDSIYLSHIESPDGQSIFVWVIEPNKNKPRAVSIPNTKNNKKAMQDAKDKTEQGIKQQMGPKMESDSDKEGELKGRGETNGGEYSTYDFRINGGGLKEVNPRMVLPEDASGNDSVSQRENGREEEVMSQPVSPVSIQAFPYEDLPEMPIDPDATNYAVDENTDF